MARCNLCGKEVEGDLAEHLAEHIKGSHIEGLRSGRTARSSAVFAVVALVGLAIMGLIYLINARFCSDLIARC